MAPRSIDQPPLYFGFSGSDHRQLAERNTPRGRQGNTQHQAWTTTETIMSAASAATTMEEPTAQQHQQTSLRFLRLQHDFQTMVKTGIGCVDEETFTALFQGRAAPHQIRHTWKLLQQQSESVVKEACAEFEVACSEVNLQQQLEELEALVLQRGLLGDANSADVPAALPAAVEAAARMAAKRAEKQQLMQTLQELQAQAQQMEGDLASKQQQAGDLVKDFKAVEDQVGKVYKAGQQWLQGGSS